MTLKEAALRVSLALSLGHIDYAIELAQAILRFYPGHLRVRSLLARALLQREQTAEAAQHFEALLEGDPENAWAHSGLALALERQGQVRGAIAHLEQALAISPGNPEIRDGYLSLRALLERNPPEVAFPPLARAKVAASKAHYAEALDALEEAAAHGPLPPSAALARLEWLWRCGRRAQAEGACRALLGRYPQAIKIKLLLAALLLERDELVEGSALLHEALSLDPSGTLVDALFHGTAFAPPKLAAALPLPPETSLTAPPDVERAIAAGAQEEESEEPPPEMPLLEERPKGIGAHRQLPEEIAAALQAVPMPVWRRGTTAREASQAKGAFVLLTSAQGLRHKYGSHGFQALQRKLEGLQEVLQEEGFAPRLCYVDDAASLASYNLSPVDPHTPGGLKGFLEALEVRLLQEDLPIAHILLLGGHDIIPFGSLPNPADDDDPLVYSDIMLAAKGHHHYAPTRSVGRLPDPTTKSPNHLLHLLDQMMAHHRPSGRRWGLGLPWLWGKDQARTFAYTALVWRRAATILAQSLQSHHLARYSPPVTDRSFEPSWLEGQPFLLFNLHGAEGSPFWFGQKDGSYPADYPLFPLALAPHLLEEVDLNGAIVFTEACYGANIVDKAAGDSLALQFLQQGAACVVGCTKIAYGSSQPPLIGADLLAQLFWQELLSGAPAGEALSRAKAAFVQRLYARQGFLDGDDQKTVLGFVLLGDPAARLAVSPVKKRSFLAEPVPVAEAAACPPLFCKMKARAQAKAPLQGDLLALARRTIQKIAPDAAGNLEVLPREVCTADPLRECHNGAACHEPTSPRPGAYLVTSRKTIPTFDGAHLWRIARLTMDERGKVLKVCVSR